MMKEKSSDKNLTPEPVQFGFVRVQGAKTPGWEGINCEELAAAADVHPMHLRAVLTGRQGTTLQYLDRLALAMGITTSEVVSGIEHAREAELARITRARERWRVRQEGRTARQTFMKASM